MATFPLWLNKNILTLQNNLFIDFVYSLIIFILAFSNYILAAFRDPGVFRKINKNQFPQEILDHGYPFEICSKCVGNPWKPPRAHHCRHCKKCIYLVCYKLLC